MVLGSAFGFSNALTIIGARPYFPVEHSQAHSVLSGPHPWDPPSH